MSPVFLVELYRFFFPFLFLGCCCHCDDHLFMVVVISHLASMLPRNYTSGCDSPLLGPRALPGSHICLLGASGWELNSFS